MKELQRIAITISQQINGTIPFMNRLCWGEEHRAMVLDGETVSIVLKVNGFSHKGYVKVTYNEGADLYDIYTSTIETPSNFELVEEGVYCDVLGQVLDRIIEVGDMDDDQYRRKVTDFFGELGYEIEEDDEYEEDKF